MGIVALIVLVFRSVFGVLVLSVVPWLLFEAVSAVVRPDSAGKSLVYGVVASFLVVLAYKTYLVFSLYPCPSSLPSGYSVSGCGVSALFNYLRSSFGKVLVAAVFLSLLFAVGAVVYVYIPEDLNIHLKRYLAVSAAVAVGLLWMVVFPWSAPLLFGL